MIEVFKTNIVRLSDAERVMEKIHAGFPGFRANFDLEDCDRILRIDSGYAHVCSQTIIQLVHDLGFHAEVLPDTSASSFSPAHSLSPASR